MPTYTWSRLRLCLSKSANCTEQGIVVQYLALEDVVRGSTDDTYLPDVCGGCSKTLRTNSSQTSSVIASAQKPVHCALSRSVSQKSVL